MASFRLGGKQAEKSGNSGRMRRVREGAQGEASIVQYSITTQQEEKKMGGE